MEDSSYVCVFPVTVVDGEELVLVGRLENAARKFLIDLGGYSNPGESAGKAAVRLLDEATLGLLGSRNAIGKKVRVKNRERVPGVGFVWKLNVSPLIQRVVIEQHASVSAFLRREAQYEPKLKRIAWAKTSELLRGKKGADRLISLVRHFRCVADASAGASPGAPQAPQ